MSEETQAVSSPAEPSLDATIPRSGSEEYANWRMTGDLPKQAQKAESPAADAPKEEKPATAAESGPAKPQEHKKSKGADHRINQLLSEVKSLREQLSQRSEPQKQAETPRERKKPTVDAVDEKGNPRYANYEDYVEDLADWKAEQRIAQQIQQMAAQAQGRELQSKVEAARQRYSDFDQVGFPALNAIVGDTEVSPMVKSMLNDSEILPDVLYVLGSDSAEMSKFLNLAKANPGKAIRYLAAIESGIHEELSKPGKTESAPEKRGPESAPAPPLETGNRGAAVDSTERLLEAAARGDRSATRQLLEAENRRMLARRRGA